MHFSKCIVFLSKQVFLYSSSSFALAWYAALPKDAHLGAQPPWNSKNSLASSA